ncbi:hypothetical protein [Caudoviricetes sp.]|nr:hypothetical protein [Caudoviricetes sp.]
MERNESHAGTYGWVALAAGVAAFDYFAPETLSHAVDRALERPMGRYAAIGAVAITAAHLLNLIPKEYDPFCLIRLEK